MQILDAIEVTWKCGKCDPMHNERFNPAEKESLTQVLDLVDLVVGLADGDPHLTVWLTENGKRIDRTSYILILCIERAVSPFG